MMYSVPCPSGGFDYFEGPARDVLPTHLAYSRAPLGATPEQAAWPLPHGARRVGHGHAPKGAIATTGRTALSGIPEGSKLPLLGMILAGVGFWKAFR